jgi:8-hydroxy-5-deazaflavin:NADPH oxidoreductase
MRIVIVGPGKVGSALARNWSHAGHALSFAVREPGAAKYDALKPLGPTIALADAAAEADVIVLAVPWPALDAAIRSLGPLDGKIVLDCVNPLEMGPDGLRLAIGHSQSAGEHTAALARGASVFKVLNTTGDNNLGDASGYPRKPLMLIAGDDAARKPVVAELVADLGFEPADAGPLVNSRLLEAHAMLWISLSRNLGWGRDVAFALMRRGTQ